MSLLKTKFIEDNAVNDLKMRLRNNLPLRSRNASDTADVSILQITTADILRILPEVDMNGQKITNMSDPTAPQDSATKQYVDSAVAGISDPKDAARVCTVTALPASTYDNGVSGVLATLTADSNGALPAIDGVGLSLNDRILVKNQGAGAENGLYIVSDLGDAGSPWVLTRADDADNSGDGVSAVTQGMFVPVAEGTVNGSLGFILTTPDPIVIGTTVLSFTQFGEVIQAGQGLTKTGTTISLDAGDGLGFSGNQLVVLTDSDLVDGTSKMVGGVLVGRRRFEEGFTFNGTDITNGYIDLAKVASRDSVLFFPRNGLKQKEVVDFNVSYTGGASGKTRVDFSGGDVAWASGDVIDINFESLDY